MGINQIKYKKLNVISKVNLNFIENIFIYQNNIWIYESDLILYNIDTLKIISTFKFPEDIISIRKIEITPQNEIFNIIRR